MVLAQAAPAAPASSNVARAWTLLEQGVADKNFEHRVHALDALALLPGTPRVRPLVEKSLGDEKEQVRAVAATALGEMKSRPSIPKLRAALDDKDPSVFLAAARSLYLMGDPEAYDILYEVVIGEKKSGDGLVRSQVKILENPKAAAKLGAEVGLSFVPFGGLGYRIFRMSREDKTSPIRAEAAIKLATDPDPIASQALKRIATDPKEIVRSAAFEAIARRRDRSLLPVAVKGMDDEDELVQYHAAAAVIRLSSK
jgi:HEAT repeat protein